MPDTIILHMSDLHFSSNEEKKRRKGCNYEFSCRRIKKFGGRVET